MGLVREPSDVDFVVDPKPLTEKEKEKISRYIRGYKARRPKKGAARHRVIKRLSRKKMPL